MGNGGYVLLRQAERHSKNQKRHLVFVFPTWNPSLLPPKTKHQNSTPLLRAPSSLVSPWCPSPSLIPIATANEQTHHTPSFLPRNALAHSRVFFFLLLLFSPLLLSASFFQRITRCRGGRWRARGRWPGRRRIIIIIIISSSSNRAPKAKHGKRLIELCLCLSVTDLLFSDPQSVCLSCVHQVLHHRTPQRRRDRGRRHDIPSPQGWWILSPTPVSPIISIFFLFFPTLLDARTVLALSTFFSLISINLLLNLVLQISVMIHELVWSISWCRAMESVKIFCVCCWYREFPCSSR